jgi:HEPN domain-containing protein
MDNHEKYVHWEDIAQYDLITARAMLSSGRFLYVVFMCQQSIEKIIKGLFVLHKGEEAPRISERYPSYREKLSTTVNQELAEEVLEKTEEVFAWLQSLTKSKLS